ncbi:MAG TPA: DUF5916 domain-containing protein [Vicinamibacteria bacterium]|nr:DUF5916 domain-containing protein [Vicinamibacteria bacterium]
MLLHVLLLAAAHSLTANSPPSPTSYDGRDGQVRVPLPRLEESVIIDGSLDDPAWTRAALLSGFSQYSPVDGRPAEQRTEVLVFYSPSAIHFGIRAFAPVGSVRASLAQRDKIAAEDSVTFLLSTFNDGRQAAAFMVNPFGVQADGTLVEGLTRQTGTGFSGLATEREAPDLAPDFVFQSKGRLTDYGYEIEVRLPFKSLRYQSAEVQSWGLHILRKSQSTGYEDSWAPARRDATSFLGQAGMLEGMRELRPGLVLDLNPFVTARADGARDRGDWRYDAGAPEFGGNVRWGVTPNLTLNGTVNPDFSQVESDASQVQYDPRIAVFFPEKRPFFLDGLEQFSTPNRLVHTRRIVAPVAAAKLTGTLSGSSLGLLSALDDAATSRSGQERPFFNILRARRDIGTGSRLGLVYTDKIDGGDWNRVAGLDARLAFAQIYSFDLQGAFAATKLAGERSDGPLFEAIFNRNGRRLGTRLLLTGIDDQFEAAAGFIGRPGIVRANADERITFFGGQGDFVESWNVDFVLDGIWTYDAFFGPGGVQDKKFHINNNARLRGGWKAGASVLIESFGFDPELYADYALAGDQPGEILPFVGVPQLQNLDWVLNVTTPDFKRFSGRAEVLWGKDENFFEWSSADIAYVTVEADWRPTEKLRAGLTYNLQQFERRSDGSLVGRRQIPRLKLEYQATRAIFARLVAEYDAQFRDELRDDSRTERPILIRDAATGAYQPALESRSNRLRFDALFAWQPTPGTVFFAGYGTTSVENSAFRFRSLSRESDGFFVKFSYLFRL